MDAQHGDTAGQYLVPTELHDRVDYLLCKLSETVKREADEAFSAYGLRGSHHALLRVLRAGGAMSQQDMASHLTVDPSTIVDLVDHLEKHQLVVRSRNPMDRRVSLLDLTGAGRRRLAAADERATTIQTEILAKLSPAEGEQLRQLLLRLVGVPDPADAEAADEPDH
jgi:DNA-binding MarR family transcriptional regulator